MIATNILTFGEDECKNCIYGIIFTKFYNSNQNELLAQLLFILFFLDDECIYCLFRKPDVGSHLKPMQFAWCCASAMVLSREFQVSKQPSDIEKNMRNIGRLKQVYSKGCVPFRELCMYIMGMQQLGSLQVY